MGEGGYNKLAGLQHGHCFGSLWVGRGGEGRGGREVGSNRGVGCEISLMKREKEKGGEGWTGEMRANPQ